MTLGRLVLAWLPVAAWFGVAAAVRRFFRIRRAPEAALALPAPWGPWTLGWLLVEALAVTLFGSLWFDTIGSGGWWLLFGLVGFLVGVPARMQQAPRVPGVTRLALTDGIVDVLRYAAAGGILAWRLA